MVALMISPDSIGVLSEELSEPLTYRVESDEQAITLYTADETAAIRLVDLAQEPLDACKKQLPILVLDNEGTNTIQVIEHQK